MKSRDAQKSESVTDGLTDRLTDRPTKGLKPAAVVQEKADRKSAGGRKSRGAHTGGNDARRTSESSDKSARRASQTAGKRTYGTSGRSNRSNRSNRPGFRSLTYLISDILILESCSCPAQSGCPQLSACPCTIPIRWFENFSISSSPPSKMEWTESTGSTRCVWINSILSIF